MKNLIAAVCALSLAGCAVAPKMGYAPPTPAKYSNSVVMPYGYDEAWKKLVAAASQTFYAIDNYEKDSGLMTLSFGSTNVDELVDCGTMLTNGVADAYVPRLQAMALTVTLNGKMNLLVQPVDTGNTRVSVNARYVLDIAGTNQSVNYYTGQTFSQEFNNTWAFDSNSQGSITVQNAAQGISPIRTCQPTGKAENDVINEIVGI